MRLPWRRSVRADPDAAQRAWRLSTNRFYVEVAECREALRQLDARARDGAHREEIVSTLLRERTRIEVACGELVEGFDQVVNEVRYAADASWSRERAVLGGLQRRVATYLRRRTKQFRHHGVQK